MGKAARSFEGIESAVGLVSSETSPKIHQLPPGGPDNPASEEQGGLRVGAEKERVTGRQK